MATGSKKTQVSAPKEPNRGRRQQRKVAGSAEAADVLDQRGSPDATDVVGIDQDRLATEDCLKVATDLLHQAPVFWGRYFKGPGNKHPTQYQASKEADFFNRHHIRVLPLGRQTPNVGGSKELGYEDGLRNAAAIIASFGAVHLSKMTGVAVFLDVEPSTPLSRNYYLGWSEGLIDAGQKAMVDFSSEVEAVESESNPQITFAPCVYGHHSDNATWKALQKSIDNGAQCEAAWVVYMDSKKPKFPIGPWRSGDFTSKYMPPSVRVVLCQRILDYKDAKHRSYDFDLANEDHKDWLFDRLVIPEALS